jgi:hypothetical protein
MSFGSKAEVVLVEPHVCYAFKSRHRRVTRHVRQVQNRKCFSRVAASELEDVGTTAGEIVHIRQRTPNCTAATAVD